VATRAEVFLPGHLLQARPGVAPPLYIWAQDDARIDEFFHFYAIILIAAQTN